MQTYSEFKAAGEKFAMPDCPWSKAWFHQRGFCGCGSPDTVGLLMRDAIAAIKAKTFTTYEPHAFREITQEEARWMLVYILDQMRLTEHGTGLVTGGWLTDSGKEFSEDIEREAEAW